MITLDKTYSFYDLVRGTLIEPKQCRARNLVFSGYNRAAGSDEFLYLELEPVARAARHYLSAPISKFKFILWNSGQWVAIASGSDHIGSVCFKLSDSVPERFLRFCEIVPAGTYPKRG